MALARFKALLLLLAVAAPALANFPNAAVLARDTAPPTSFQFDVNAGAEMQTQTSEKSAPRASGAPAGEIVWVPGVRRSSAAPARPGQPGFYLLCERTPERPGARR